MPRRDSSGPMGQGPRTGRGLGICGSNTNADYGRGYGRGLGRGLGRGYGYGYQQVGSKELLAEEKKALEDRIKYINSELDKK